MKIVEIFIKKLTYKNYSKNSISTYAHYLEVFLKDINKNPYHITTKEIEDYLLNKKYTSTSQQNQIIGSLKLFAKHILNKKDIHLAKIERPKREKSLPKVIDKDFLVNRITAIKNLKHKAILMLGYSCGLRVSELINLKMDCIDRKRMLILIKNAKGKKDRYVVLSENLLSVLEKYYKAYKPKVYLFNGQNGSLQYSSTSCNKLVKKYLGGNYHFHQLRHSNATALLESGTDITIIQKLLGHKRIETTQIYTHISNNVLSRVQMPI